ncbi:MAG: type I methionyl aminopeptidase [Candidatus Moranbacteria bacterium]|nr:type I methionyl aminopeptidase [Candidatus Moranbacteria bacterium]
MITIKTPREIEIMRQGGKILKQTLKELKAIIKPGISRKKINQTAGEILKKKKAKPAFLNYQGYPANLCIFTNEEVEHGLPENKIIHDGDLVTLDLGVKYKGLFTDASTTFICGKKSKEKLNIIKVCRRCLDLGIAQAKAGKRIGDIGYAVQKHAEKNGYSVVRKLVGHGVGYAIHENPIVPNFGKKGTGQKLKTGMCLAIEPMINQGTHEIDLKKDGWTYVTRDGKLSCHLEHTIVVGAKKAEVLA